jgi:hypothetical protein
MKRLTTRKEEGFAAALEKLGVSGALYAQALRNATERSGGRIAPQVLGQMAAKPRAQAAPFLSEQARAPGALAPTLPQQSAQAIMERVPWAGSEHGGNAAAAMQRFDQALRGSGRLHAQPGVNQRIIQEHGFPAGSSPELAPTLRTSAMEQTVAGKRR